MITLTMTDDFDDEDYHDDCMMTIMSMTTTITMMIKMTLMTVARCWHRCDADGDDVYDGDDDYDFF